MKAREILKRLALNVSQSEGYGTPDIDQALSALSKLVLEVKELRISDSDDVVDYIAKLFQTGKVLKRGGIGDQN